MAMATVLRRLSSNALRRQPLFRFTPHVWLPTPTPSAASHSPTSCRREEDATQAPHPNHHRHPPWLVQSLKEIVNCPEAEIYAVPRECGMDLDEAVSCLLS